MASILAGVRVRRSIMAGLVPSRRARSTSSALAAVISSARLTRASAIAARAVSFTERLSVARSTAALPARSATAWTSRSMSLLTVIYPFS